MPAQFTKTFAQRVNRDCAASVVEATHGAAIEVGKVYIAPGGNSHLEVSGQSSLQCRLRSGDPVNGHRPSVDALFMSAATSARAGAVGVILTGMGRDGADGLLAMRRTGARTLGQDEQSCVVYGMPKMAFQCGAVEKQVPLSRLGTEILSLTSASQGKAS